MIEKLADSPNGEALSWLLEMELVSSPYVLNSIILNMMTALKGVRDVELVIDEKQKKILIYLELNWYHARFKAAQVEAQAGELIQQILPSFKRRIIFNREILEKSLKLMQAR